MDLIVQLIIEFRKLWTWDFCHFTLSIGKVKFEFEPSYNRDILKSMICPFFLNELFNQNYEFWIRKIIFLFKQAILSLRVYFNTRVEQLRIFNNLCKLHICMYIRIKRLNRDIVSFRTLRQCWIVFFANIYTYYICKGNLMRKLIQCDIVYDRIFSWNYINETWRFRRDGSLRETSRKRRWNLKCKDGFCNT